MKLRAAIPGMILSLMILPRCFAQADVSGAWDLTVNAPQGTAHPSVNFIQSGEKLSGTYRGRMGESKLEGTVRENAIRFSVTLRFQDQSFVVAYSGTVEGATMKGTVQFGDSATGTWTAKRSN